MLSMLSWNPSVTGLLVNCVLVAGQAYRSMGFGADKEQIFVRDKGL